MNFFRNFHVTNHGRFIRTIRTRGRQTRAALDNNADTRPDNFISGFRQNIING